MNFEYSDPIRLNELFRPILQELTFRDSIDFEELKFKLILNVTNTFKKYKNLDFNNSKLTSQINVNLNVKKSKTQVNYSKTKKETTALFLVNLDNVESSTVFAKSGSSFINSCSICFKISSSFLFKPIFKY